MLAESSVGMGHAVNTYSGGDVDRHDPITQLLLLLVRDCVGADHLLQLAVVDLVDRVTAEDTVGHDGDGSSCAVLDDHVGCFAEGAASVCHVVDDDSGTTLDIAHQNHATNFVRASALLVDQRELNVKAVGDRSCSVSAVLAVMSIDACVSTGEPYLFAPPASGETITQSCGFKFSRIHLSVLGSA